MPTQSSARFPVAVVVVCGLAVAFDAYELVAYGATMPELIEEFGMSATTAGLLGSVVLVGTLVGSIGAGLLATMLDRTVVFMGAIVLSSVFTVACAFTSTAAALGACRFLAGLAIGGLIPLAATITHAATEPRHRTLTYTIMQSGFPLGGIAASAAAMVLIPRADWHAVYLLTALPLATVLPAAWMWLPRTGRTDTNTDPAGASAPARLHAAVSTLFSARFRRTTTALWLMVIAAMLVVYGANTWIPQLMSSRDGAEVSGLWFLLLFNAGAIIGGLLAAALADRYSMMPVVSCSFAIGAVAILAFALTDSAVVLALAAVFAGYGAVGTQTLLNSWATDSYPEWLKATGAGWALGVGRIGGIAGPYLVGALITYTAGSSAAFWMFALVALLGAAIAVAGPGRPAAAEPEPPITAEKPAQ